MLSWNDFKICKLLNESFQLLYSYPGHANGKIIFPKFSMAKKLSLLMVAVIVFGKNNQAQNIGIGTSGPTEKLHVSGNIKADTIKPSAIKLMPRAGNNKVLTSDASGNASWQTPAASASNTAGFGSWGDCGMNNLSEYHPVTDTGASSLDKFGFSVSMDGDFAVVGAPFDDWGSGFPKGSASVYHFNGTAWEFMQKLSDTGSNNSGDQFGYSVSISGSYIIVGIHGDNVGVNNGQGSVNIYYFDGTIWNFTEKLTDPDGAALNEFGFSVSISGVHAVVGSYADYNGPNIGQGASAFFNYDGTSWQLVTDLTHVTTTANDRFGFSVSVSGDSAVIGIPRETIAGNTTRGAANVYRFDGTNWIFLQKLTDPDGAANDQFGSSVSISSKNIMAGAPEDQVGANSSQGSACMFSKSNNGFFTFSQKVFDPAGSSGDFFGLSVAVTDKYAVAGAFMDEPGAYFINQGAATLYQKVGLGWQKLQFVTDPGGLQGDNLGCSVTLSETSKRFVFGACNYSFSSGKILFGKINL